MAEKAEAGVYPELQPMYDRTNLESCDADLCLCSRSLKGPAPTEEGTAMSTEVDGDLVLIWARAYKYEGAGDANTSRRYDEGEDGAWVVL